ncbi:HET-domain-containing protein [Xylariaceae sp. AK1471]|nr:HET-domain-containing protein [Xylariaceae sp. AK1471]
MKYEYPPLSNLPGNSLGVFSIRLLHLLPASNRGVRLECELVETHIPDYVHDQSHSSRALGSTHVPYQALSYTWGDPEFPRSLHVISRGDDDGAVHATPAGIINITENLYSALQNLRELDKTLVLWVDAVCIDQGNILERNSQVGNIPQTYAGAASVLVWLGTDDFQHNGRLCFSFFTHLAALIAGDADGGRQDHRASWRKRFKINQMVSAFLDIAQPRPIDLFLSRPWFRRRWIVQEVVLAKDVSVHCDGANIPWSTFETSLTELYENDKGGFSHEHRTVLRTMSHIRNTNLGAKSQVPLDTLVEFESFDCANPRDRLYALYGVIQQWFPGPADKEAQTGTIDYALSTKDVFTNFAVLMTRLNDTLPSSSTYHPVCHVLQLAAALQQPTPRGEHLTPRQVWGKIPSWVPNWTGILTYTPLNHSPIDRDASFGIPKRKVEVQTFYHDVRLLVSIGLVYDIVTATFSLDTEALSGTVYDAKAALNDLLCSVAKGFDDSDFFGDIYVDEYRPTGEHIISALATALVANWDRTPANSYFAQHRRFSRDFLEQLDSSKYHLSEILHKWPAYIELLAITMRGRRLFLTHSGYIGVCPASVRAGDVICILSDMRIPFILRPQGVAAVPAQDGLPHIPGCYSFNEERLEEFLSIVENESSACCTFQLMGDAYVHGLMNGEAAGRLGGRLDDFTRILPIG